MDVHGDGAAPRRTRRSPRGDVRRRLLDSARVEFAAGGYDGVSLDQIADAAGFSKGAVYSNFASKNELFLALMDESIGARLDAARAAAKDAGDADKRAAARTVGNAIANEFATDDDWHVLFVEFWMRAVRDPSIREPFAQHRRHFRQMIADLLEEMPSGDEPELTADDIATTILALSNGLAIERILDKESGSPALFGILLERLLVPNDPLQPVAP